MATINELNFCSACNKTQAKSICAGCKKYFCRKDFKEHEQQLSIKFDNDIVRSHDELLEQMQKLEKSNYLSLDLFNQIEQWKKTAIKKVEKAADKVHHELIELIDKQRMIMTKQLEPITREIRSLRKEENFAEDDINRLRKKINEIQQKLKQFIEKDTNKSIIIDNNQIDWNHLICIREIQPRYISTATTDNISDSRRRSFSAIRNGSISTTAASTENDRFSRRASTMSISVRATRDLSSHSIGEVQELFVQDLSDQEDVHQHTEKLKNELAKRKNESKKNQKIVQTQQRMSMAQNSYYYTCAICGNAFLSNAYLQAHMHRRHPNYE
ncbi:unnamed protein product [Rotaria sordida]|uniref:C2H2-type domain-containing protein n=1 Tax=Rotaria sordida TaxID=392033 RepID=A0A814HAF4_9BILA|nr:unnamed protein product [Rotaria sordida]